MRFGRDLHRHRIPEWSAAYLNYDELKKSIKFATKSALDDGSQVEGQALFTKIEFELERVEAFFWKQINLIEKWEVISSSNYTYTYPTLASTLNYSPCNPRVLQPREARDILAGFLEARDAIHKLQWFCKVNRDGFVCLLRKLEDCPPCAEKPNLDDYSFASPSACADFLRQICHSIRFISRPCNEEIGGKFHDDRKKPEHSYLTNGLPHTRDLTCAIAENDVSALIVALKDYNSISPLYRQELRFARLAALHVSVMSGSRDCISHLLQRLDTIRNDKTASKQNCIHRLVIAMGRLSTLSARYPKTENFEIACSLPRELEDSLSLLVFLLDKLLSDQRSALLDKDHFGRIPLHYAAQYGLKDACEVIVDRMQKWKLLTDEEEQSSMLIDIEGYTPLHLGVFEEHTDVLTSLLRLQVQSPTINSIDGPREASSNLLAALLISAVESGSVDIVKILLSNSQTYTGYTQQRGETALFCAARRGNLEVVKLLIEAHRAQGVILDLPEQAFGWTPLIVACVNNHVQIVEALLQAGANAKHQDVYQWTAKDHAAFRARWEVEKLLPPSTLETTTRVLKRSPAELAAITPCLRDESKIIVHLGTLNTRAQEAAVDLNLHRHTDNNFRHQHAKSSSGLKYPYAGYSVEIKARGACGSSHEISLPVLEDATNFPTIFTAKDPSAVQLLFIFYDNFGKEKVHIGTAIALLKNLKDGLGINLESFSRNYTIPIHDGFMDFIGTVTFNFLVVKPFDHPNSIFTTPQEIWTLGEPTHIVGHRGFGQNNPSCRRLQIGENTIQSFMSTISQGVNFIECDVQLTRDHVPIIYHDFLVSESGADLAPYNLSFDQFMHINETQTSVIDSFSVFEEKAFSSNGGSGQATPLRPRSRSVDLIEKGRNRDFVARMRKTHEYKLKGFKGNTRGDHIHHPFASLVELLHSLPEHVGILLELKYPMLFEAEDWKMDPSGPEINKFIDTILSVTFEHAKNRSILLASFTPEICILAAYKQTKYPVRFLSESGLYSTGDIRASSLQQAVHFAKRWGLSGVIMESNPFVSSPALIGYVKEKGLGCASWGGNNDVPENALIQAEAGLDAIVVDSVRLISNTLKVPRP